MTPAKGARRTIRSELFLAVISINFITLLITNVVYFTRLQAVIQSEIEILTAAAFSQVSGRIDEMGDRVATAGHFVISLIDEESPLFADKGSLNSRLLESIDQSRRLLTTVKQAYPFIDEIYLIGSDGWILSNNSSLDTERFLRQEWILNTERAALTSLVVPSRRISYYNMNTQDAGPEMISFVFRAALFSAPEKRFSLQIDVPTREFRTPLAKAMDESGLRVHIITPRDLPLLNDLERRGRPTDSFSRLLRMELEQTGWQAEAWISTARYDSRLQGVRRLALLLGSAAFISSLILAALTSRKLTQPLQEMIRVMDDVGGGDLSRGVPTPNNEDLRHVSAAFNTMLTRIRRLMGEIREKESERALAEFRALEAQVNPHFLYNSLNTIQAMAGAESPVARMSRSLARLFRYSIDPSGDAVPLEEEVEHLMDYITLQGYRFADRIRAKLNFSDAPADFPVPRLILQPLVENCYKHGFETLTEGGLITVSTRIEKGDLLITVEDNGAGIESAQLKRIMKELRARKEKSADGNPLGIGIPNLYMRLYLTYKRDNLMQIESTLGKGTRIELTIPPERAERMG